MEATGRGGLSDEEWMRRVGDALHSSAKIKFGDYEDLEEVAAGGQGVVWRGRQRGTRRLAALKKLRAGTFATSRARRRFERELEILASLNHPNIVTVFGLESEGEEQAIAMEWVDGVALNEWARGKNRSAEGVREILNLFLQVCDGMQHAHLRGVIHRDLKPANILSDGDGRARILDFGLATREGADGILTIAAGFAGTPAYASPEQVRERADGGGGDGGAIDARTDIYSLGVVLYELVTGRLPVDTNRSLVELLNSIERDEPARPSAICKNVPREFDAVILKCLAKEREQRYQSVPALAEDIRRFLGGEPVLANPPGFYYYFRKLVFRHPRTSALAAAAAMFILGLGIYLYLQSERLKRENTTIESLLSLMLNFMDSASPGALGPDARMLDVIEKRAADFEMKLKSRPDVLATFHNYLGHTFLTTGRLDDAESHLARALALRTEALGESHIENAQIRCLLGEVALQQYRLDDAEKLFQLAESAQRVDMKRSPIAHTLLAFGALDLERRRFERARDRAREAAAIRKMRFGESSAPVAECILLEASAEAGLDNLTKSADLAESALKIYHLSGQERTPGAARAHGAIANIQIKTGARNEAKEHLQKALEIARGIYTNPNMLTAEILILMMDLARATGDDAGALRAAADASAILRAVRGGRDPRLAGIENLIK